MTPESAWEKSLEVVVAGDLAAEHGALFAHAVLEEGMPDPVDERDAAGAFDRLRHRPARADVVEDLRARFPLDDRLGEESRDEVAGHELTGVVDEEAAVGVAVERDPDVGVLLPAPSRR